MTSTTTEKTIEATPRSSTHLENATINATQQLNTALSRNSCPFLHTPFDAYVDYNNYLSSLLYMDTVELYLKLFSNIRL